MPSPDKGEIGGAILIWDTGEVGKFASITKDFGA